jgi:AcrR family transcriptional regulator
MTIKSNKSAATLERIFLAAIECYGRNGVDNTSLEQVARLAGVSRTTVYRHAKNRRELLNLVLLRDAHHALEELQVTIRYHQRLEQAVLESILFLMRRRDNYKMQQILYGDHTKTSLGSGLPMEELSTLASYALKDHFEKSTAASTVPEGLTLPVLSDWVARITMSLHSQPSPYTESETALREYLQIVLTPIFRI